MFNTSMSLVSRKAIYLWKSDKRRNIRVMKELCARILRLNLPIAAFIYESPLHLADLVISVISFHISACPGPANNFLCVINTFSYGLRSPVLYARPAMSMAGFSVVIAQEVESYAHICTFRQISYANYYLA